MNVRFPREGTFLPRASGTGLSQPLKFNFRRNADLFREVQCLSPSNVNLSIQGLSPTIACKRTNLAVNPTVNSRWSADEIGLPSARALLGYFFDTCDYRHHLVARYVGADQVCFGG